MATSYFEAMFTKDESVILELVEDLFDQKVDQQVNEELISEFTDDEISNALFQIGPLKAPDVDEFPARFFQRNWGVLKEEVIEAVRKFFWGR